MVITVPRWMWEKKKSVVVRPMEETPRATAEGGVAAQKKPVDFSSLKGVLKDVPEFKGKTSVEVKHMITSIWAKKTGARLVSYDKDFDLTDIRRVTPEEILPAL